MALQASKKTKDNGTFALVLANVVGYVLDHVVHLEPMKALYLYHASWRPWQLVTSLFCHGSFSHLSSNLFFLLVFGRFVEDTGGPWGVVLCYLTTGVFANIASLLLIHGGVVSLGASGAVFGLFVVAVLARFSWNVRRLLESLILGNFVVNQVLEEGAQTMQQAGVSRTLVQTNHIAHLGGALGGVLLILLLRAVSRDSKEGAK